MTGRRLGRFLIFISTFISVNAATISFAVRQWFTGIFFTTAAVIGVAALIRANRDEQARHSRHRRLR